MPDRIDSPQNPRIKATARLRTHRGRDQQGRIVIDGDRELRRAIECGIEVESIFLSEEMATPPQTLDAWSESGAALYLLSNKAFEKVAFGQRQEVVGVARTPDCSLQQIKLGDNAKIAVLERIEKPGNLGAVLRSADGAGMDAVILVDAVTDLFNPNAIRASLGTIFSMQVASVSFDQYREWLTKHPLRQFLAICDPSTESYERADFNQPCAIVLGNEAEGLTDRWLQLDNSECIRLPMRGIADSLNVSVAAAVLFYAAMASR